MSEPVLFGVGADLNPFKKEMAKVSGISKKAGELAGKAVQAGFAAAVAAAGAGGLFAKGVLEEGAQFETLSTRLTTLMGDATAARDRMQELALIGQTTPFELPGVVEADAVLRGFNANAEETLPLVLDMAAALGLDVNEAAQAVGRAFAGGAGAADVLRERGVLAAIELRTGIKATNMEIGQFREELMVTLSDYEGGSARLAATLDGQVSNLKDSWGDFQRQVADASFYDASKAAVTEINRLLIDNEEAISAAAQTTGVWLKGSLMFAVQTTGDLVVAWKRAEQVVVSIKGIVAGLNVATNNWLADLRQGIADALPEGSRAQKFIQEQADGRRALAESYRAQMNLARQEGDEIKREIAEIEAATEGVLRRIEQAGVGGATEARSIAGPAAEEEALQAKKGVAEEEIDWEQRHQDALTALVKKGERERLQVAQQAAAQREALARQATGTLVDLTTQGVQMRLNEEASGAEISRAISLGLFSDLLRQLSAYFATRSAAAAATGNLPRAALFAAGAAVAAGGATAIDSQATADGSSTGGTEEVTLGNDRRVINNRETGDTDGGLARAADRLLQAADAIEDAADRLGRSGGTSRSSSRGLTRILRRERSQSGLIPSFQGA